MSKLFLFLIVMCSSLLVSAQSMVTICWDASLSMGDRDIEKEFDFLENYFTKNPHTTVSFIVFANTLISQNTLEIVNSDWSQLKKKIVTIPNDGGTSFKDMQSLRNEDGDVLLFTDGYQNISPTNPKFKGSLFIVNTNKIYDEESLKIIALLNKGRLVNLASNYFDKSNKEIVLYKGQIFNNNEIANNVSVSVKGSSNSTQVNENGAYSIEAKPGDTLVFVQNGKASAEKELGKINTINVFFDDNDVRLEEVLVIAKKSPKNKEQVVTGHGLQNKDKVGYAIQTVGGDNLTATATDVSQAVEGKFTGLSKGINDDLSQAVIRGINTFANNNYAAIAIDGVFIAQSNSSSGGRQELTDFIDVNNIADITVLKGYAATNMYGSLGSNGVILITTKTSAGYYAPSTSKNTALVKNNIYDGKLVSIKKRTDPSYIKTLKKEATIEGAYKVYLEQRDSYREKPEYFIEVYDFLKESNQELADQIITNLLEIDNSTYPSLRAMLLKVSNDGNRKLTLDVAYALLGKFPQQIQSYLDVAIANKDVGDYQLALDMLLAIDNGTINPELDFTALAKIADNEIRSLIRKKRSELETSKIEVKHLKLPELDARIIFDWNNPDAEFELQFVNPSKRFFKWEHTRNNPERIKDELVNGYCQEEFEIDGGDKGKWLITAKYLGNRTSGNDEPTFLKCSVQYNFGKPSERIEEYILRLSQKGEEELIATIITK